MVRVPSSIRNLLEQIASAPNTLRDIWQSSKSAIDRLNPAVNAICTHRETPDIELQIGKLVERLVNKEPIGMLIGMPYVAKDIHATAGKGDVGFCNTWTLEISVSQPVIIYAGMPIGQLIYFKVSGEI